VRKKKDDLIYDLKGKGIRIRTLENTFSLLPNYMHYSFISTFIPVLIACYVHIVGTQSSWKISLGTLIIGSLTPIILFFQLKYFNTVSINYLNNSLSVIPNPILRVFYRKKIIPFGLIRRFEKESSKFIDGFATRGYIIVLVLKDNDKVKLIGVYNYSKAKQIEEFLPQILK
jgi:hypothetical protein